MLTEYFMLNRKDPEARSLMYADIPTAYTFHVRPKHWSKRKQGNVIGRIIFIPPGTTDVYFLRMLLTKVPGPTSFEDLMTVNGKLCKDYKEACMLRGFLIDDGEPEATMIKVRQWGMPALLRSLFVMILVHSEVADPGKLFETNWKLFADDFSYQAGRGLNLQHFQAPDEYLKNQVIKHIETLLHSHFRSLADFGLPQPTDYAHSLVSNRLICEQLNYDVCMQKRLADEIFSALNRGQQDAYHSIMTSVEQGLEKFFFLYGHGGTGKTYLYNTIIAKLAKPTTDCLGRCILRHCSHFTT
ncbi:unnamed protein product [Linum trigynum]|uniref:ATP-dependent DNA helicase n=1 Tax=Linum trigynum TaxID=586398 RepID=A0AAV2CKV4_9ROSI